MASGAVVGAPRSMPAGGWGVSIVLSSDPRVLACQALAFVPRRDTGARLSISSVPFWQGCRGIAGREPIGKGSGRWVSACLGLYTYGLLN